MLVNIVFWSSVLSGILTFDQTTSISTRTLSIVLTTLMISNTQVNAAEFQCGSTFTQTLPSNNVWSKDVLTREQYHRKLCGKTCRGQDVQECDSACPYVQCFDCMCEQPKCQLYGICCPSNEKGQVSSNKHENGHQGVDEEMGTASAESASTSQGDADTESKHPVESPVIECETSGDQPEGYLSVRSCPSHFRDSQTRDLCEKDYDPVTGTTLDQFARVTDNVTEVTYFNWYCALCNEAVESQLVQWTVTVSCDHFMYVYDARTFDQLLTKSLESNSACQVEQEPLVQYLTPCKKHWFSNDSITSCNVTGLWKVRDKDVERACQEMNGWSHSVYVKRLGSSSSMLYKNVFCAICNMAAYPDCREERVLLNMLSASFDLAGSSLGRFTSHGMTPSDPLLAIVKHEQGHAPSLPKRQPPFKLILGFRRKRPRPVYKSSFTFNACETGEWPSPDGLCLKLHCSPGKVSMNESCVTALPQIRGLGYRFSLWFESDGKRSTHNATEEPYFSNDYITEVYQYFEDKVNSDLNGSIDGYEINLKIVSSTNNDTSSTPNNEYQARVALWLQVFVSSRKTIPRDEFEMSVISSIENLAWHAPTIVTGNFNLQLVHRPSLGYHSSLCSTAGTKCAEFSGHDREKRLLTFAARDAFLTPGQFFGCQYVEFNDSNYVIDQANRGLDIVPRTKLSLTIGTTTMVFTKSTEFTSMFVDERRVLRVCHEVLDSMLKKLEDDRQREFFATVKAQSQQSSTESTQYYMTLACLGVSMFCLVLTLLTYFSFKVLRNPAGMNNIFLCGSLLLAQAFLLASSHVSEPRPLCTVLGMMTHFLWLWMFVWSFICCFHMFRVFTTKTRGHHTIGCACCHASRLLCTVALSLVCPAAVVCVVLSVSLAASGGDRTGYGKDLCYLDSALLVGLTTVLPLALVTVSNVVFFTITVTKIHRIRKLQTHESFKKNDRQNLYIYIKLSTVTGAFWLVQILAETLNNDVLRFIAIIANGLQGVFIFISYMCNKRVISLYLQSLGVIETTLTSSSTPRKVTGKNMPQSSSTSCSFEGLPPPSTDKSMEETVSSNSSTV